MMIPTRHSGYKPDGRRLYHIPMPKAPDMSGANAAAREGAQISREQWEWTKARQPELDAQANRLIQIGEDQYKLNRDQQVYQQGLSRRYDDRYWGSVVPMQDRMLADAQDFDTDARREELAAEATADVTSAFTNARAQQSRGLSRMGVNPSSGRALAMDNQATLAQAAASASAANKVRQAARMEGYGRKVDANAMLSGLSGFGSTAAQVSTSSGNSAAGAAGMGMSGLNQAGAGFLAGANGAASGLQSASGNLRANAIESAKNPGFDFVAGLATAAVGGYAQGMGKK